MHRVNIKNTILLFSSVLALTACENAKEDLGLVRKAPDEFAVVRRAPLEMPPDYSLRPPQPGVERPQEMAVEEQAKQTVFGKAVTQNTEVKPATAEELILQKTGGDTAENDIRRIVDQETSSMEGKEQPVAKKILGLGGDGEAPASVVDAAAETERLRTNAEEGKPVTEGETPSIEE